MDEREPINEAHHLGVISALRNPAVVSYQGDHLELVKSGPRILLRKVFEAACWRCDRLGLKAGGCFQDFRLEDFSLLT